MSLQSKGMKGYPAFKIPCTLHMLTGMTGMFVMAGYRQASIWNVGMVLKWAWMKLTVYFHLARLETDSLLSCARKDATGPNCGNQRLGGGVGRLSFFNNNLPF